MQVWLPDRDDILNAHVKTGGKRHGVHIQLMLAMLQACEYSDLQIDEH